MNAKAKEAQPILRRSQHYFKIVTLYVVDKLNYNMERKQKLAKRQKINANAQQQIANQSSQVVSFNQSAPAKALQVSQPSSLHVDPDTLSQNSAFANASNYEVKEE